MQFRPPRLAHPLTRLSAAMALLLSVMYALLILMAAHWTTSGYDLVVMIPAVLSLLVPFAGGLVALFNPRNLPLGLAWGWVLGVNVSRVIIRMVASLQPLPIPPALRHQTYFVVGQDYFGMAVAAFALIGVALCVADEYGQGRASNT